MYTPQVLNSLAAAEKRNLSVAGVLKKKKKKSSHLQPTLMMIFHAHAHTQTHTHALVLARHMHGGVIAGLKPECTRTRTLAGGGAGRQAGDAEGCSLIGLNATANVVKARQWMCQVCDRPSAG